MFGSPRRCDRRCFGERSSLLVRRRFIPHGLAYATGSDASRV